jgi:hypothetical protein
MLNSAYLVVDPQTKQLEYTLVVPWSFSDEAALKDKTKAYILIALRDSRAEGLLECEKWKQIYLEDPSQAPTTIGTVWKEYFKYCKEFQTLPKVKREIKPKFTKTSTENLPLWSTIVTCERCKRMVRLGVYNTKHADGKCKNKKKWFTKEDLARLAQGLDIKY